MSKVKNLGLKRTIIGAGALLIVGVASFTSYATTNISTKTKENTEISNEGSTNNKNDIIEIKEDTPSDSSLDQIKTENSKIIEDTKVLENPHNNKISFESKFNQN